MFGSRSEDAARLQQEAEVLRGRLMRTLKALTLVEDQRAETLSEIAVAADLRAVPDLMDRAQRARANADVAMSLSADVERMRFHGDPPGAVPQREGRRWPPSTEDDQL
jgi:hypothetical protein